MPGLLLCALVGWLTERVAWLMCSSLEVDGLASLRGALGLSARCAVPGELAWRRRRARGAALLAWPRAPIWVVAGSLVSVVVEV